MENARSRNPIEYGMNKALTIPTVNLGVNAHVLSRTAGVSSFTCK
jgi:hypothetical protein